MTRQEETAQSSLRAGARVAQTRPVALVAVALWCLLVLGAWGFAIEEILSGFRDNSLQQSRVLFQEILSTRAWNALHGGVYVPVTEDTPPNLFLDDPQRDVVTTDGMRLTKVTPAHMIRLVSELGARGGGVRFRLTSERPLNPDNEPDPWEREALASFEAGATESARLLNAAGAEPLYRYIAPLKVVQECAGCHAKRGYRMGDVLGGLSVTLDIAPALAVRDRHLIGATLTFTLLGFLGLLGIAWGSRRLLAAEASREATIRKLEGALAEVRTLSGLLPICASCKKVRNDEGYWEQIEVYVRDRSDAEFTHGLCPSCASDLFPGLEEEDDESPERPA